jgi:phosphatidylserine synthase
VLTRGDKAFYLGYAMVATASITAIAWNSLLTDRRDGLVLGVLMVSNVKYPKMPAFSFRTGRQAMVTVLVLGCMLAALIRPDYVLFPLGSPMACSVSYAGPAGLSERHEPEVAAAVETQRRNDLLTASAGSAAEME